MDSSFVKDLEKAILAGININVEDQIFSTVKMFPVVDDRRIETLIVESLSSLVEFVKLNIDGLNRSKIFFHVVAPDLVCVRGVMEEKAKFRDIIVQAKLGTVDKFPYGQFLDSEEFIIKLKSLFIKTDDQVELINFISRLTINNSLEVGDDGVSQNAIVKKGLSGALKDKEQAPSIVDLTPWRTFREIEQPSSNFLFRMRSRNSEAPQCALFEADGSNWKLLAVEEIEVYILDHYSGATVIS